MPIVAKRVEDKSSEWGGKMDPSMELLTISSWGKCDKRLERVLVKKADVNHKNDDGMTPLHLASLVPSPKFVKRFLEARADPNVVGGTELKTPLDMAAERLENEENIDKTFNDFESINKLDNGIIPVRPDLKPWREVKQLLIEAGGVHGKASDDEPNIKPNGSVNGGPPSGLRAYTKGQDGSYTIPYQLRTGSFDVLGYEVANGGMLVQGEFDPANGHWDLLDGRKFEAGSALEE